MRRIKASGGNLPSEIRVTRSAGPGAAPVGGAKACYDASATLARSGAAVIRRIRLVSGLTLFAFILGHFLNHALGLVSLGAMERSLEFFFAVWRSPPGQLALYTAFSAHFALA